MKPNARFCLDAFAWLAWLQDEAGAPAGGLELLILALNLRLGNVA